MHWIIIFVVSWILFVLLIDWRQLKYNMWGGILAFVLATMIDYFGTHIGLYKFYNVILPWFGCSVFYKFGPIICVGILFTQRVPDNKWLQIVNVIFVSAMFLFLEQLLVTAGDMKYMQWGIFGSIIINLYAFISLTWISNEFIKPKIRKDSLEKN